MNLSETNGAQTALAIALQGNDETPVTDLIHVSGTSTQSHAVIEKAYKVKSIRGKLTVSIVAKSGSAVFHSMMIQRINTE